MRFLLLAVVATGCTTLGPTPVLTGLPVAPAHRTSVAIETGFMPGFYLSDTVSESPSGTSIPQLSVAVELGKRLGAPGLVLGGRAIGGPGSDGQVDPMIGYRTSIGGSPYLSVGGFLSGTRTRGSDDGADYEVTRLAAEASFDWQINSSNRGLEVHLIATASATGIDAEGTYCLDASGKYGVDCDGEGDTFTDAELSGVYPAAAVGVALHTLRFPHGRFHGLRALLMAASGAMPRVLFGDQERANLFTSVAFSISVAFGARD
jgi:hypothetical protein